MGRPNRIQFPGACYYVTLRGNNRQDLFVGHQDRRYFLALLKSLKAQYGILIFAYCLMNDSIDLLIETSRPNLSRLMQNLGTLYTKYFHRAHSTGGHLFQGRYRALVVDQEQYLLEMTCAVHLKPGRSAAKPWRYLWSSCAAYVHSEEREPLVDTKPVLRLLAKNRLQQSVRYLHYIQERLNTGTRPIPLHGIVVGSPEFAASLRGRGSAVEAEQIMEHARRIAAEILAAHPIGEEVLFGRGQKRSVSAIRKEAMVRIWKETGLGVSDIGRMFHRTPAAVSQLIRSVEAAGAAHFPS